MRNLTMPNEKPKTWWWKFWNFNENLRELPTRLVYNSCLDPLLGDRIKKYYQNILRILSKPVRYSTQLRSICTGDTSIFLKYWAISHLSTPFWISTIIILYFFVKDTLKFNYRNMDTDYTNVSAHIWNLKLAIAFFLLKEQRKQEDRRNKTTRV